MKRKTAREILSESFLELAESKPVDKITVQEIADNCGYSPATFYRNFKDKYDLIAWNYAQEIASVMTRVGEDHSLWAETLLDAARYYQLKKNYLANLLLHTTGHDSFIRYMADINFDTLKKHIQAVSGAEALDGKTEMYIRLYCLGTVNLTCEWILGKYDVTAEELAEIYKNSMPVPLQLHLSRE